MSETAGMTVPVRPRFWFFSRRQRRHDVSRQLEAYATAVLANLEANASGSPAVATLRLQIEQAMRDFRERGGDAMLLFLTIKGLEYRITSELHYEVKEFRWFVQQDLRATPASEEVIQQLCSTFLADENGKGVETSVLAKVTHLSLGYWRQYAETVLKACRRDRFVAAALAMCITIFFGRQLISGVRELFQGLQNVASEPWNWNALAQWFLNTPEFGHLALGCAGSIVSMSLAGRSVALQANRPLDDLYIFWSSVPRLFIGALAGILAAQVIHLFAPLNVSSEGASQVLQIFLAFSGGFADRLFFQKLVDSTWQVSGLSEPKKA